MSCVLFLTFLHKHLNLSYSPCLILDQRPFCTAETTGPVSFIQRGDTWPIQTINEMFFNYEALVICQQSQPGVQRVDSFHDRVVSRIVCSFRTAICVFSDANTLYSHQTQFVDRHLTQKYVPSFLTNRCLDKLE